MSFSAKPETHSGSNASPKIRLNRTTLEYLILLSLAIVALLRWVQLIEHVRNYYVDLPTWDYWRVPQNLAAYRAGNLKALWSPHNEHRIICPEIIFALDTLYFHGRKILPTVAQFMCYSGTLVLLIAAVSREREMRTPIKIAAGLLAAIIMGWMGAAIVLGDPFLLQWTLLHFFVAASLTLLYLARCQRNRLLLATAILSAIGATYTSGNGMLLWPVLIAVALLLEFPRIELSALLVAALASIGAFFLGYHSPNRLNAFQFVHNFDHALDFIASYLAMPFAADRSRRFGIDAGFASLALLALLFWTAARRKLLRTLPATLLFGVCAFTLLSALLASAGRMDPSDRTFILAKQARYVTAPLINWTALLLLTLWLGSKISQPVWKSWRVPALTALLLFLGFRHLSAWVKARDAEVADLQLGALGVQAGILDDAVLQKFFPSPAFVRAFLPELKSDHLSIYSEQETNWVGEPIAAFSKHVLAPQSATIRYELALPSGTELGLVAPDSGSDWLVFTNRSQIVGLGRHLSAGVPFVFEKNIPNSVQSVFAFINGHFPIASLQVYLVRHADCALIPLRLSPATQLQ